MYTRARSISPYGASLPVADVPAPAPKCLDDFRGNRTRERDPEEDQGLVHSVRKEQLSPYAC